MSDTTTGEPASVVYVVAGAAPPVLRLATFLDLLEAAGWKPCVILTPTAAGWVDQAGLARHSEYPIRVTPRLPHEPDPLPRPDVVVAAPLTFNTLNKWAAGITDTQALGSLVKAIGLGVPIVAAPIVGVELRRHPAYANSIAALESVGVSFLDPDAVKIRAADDTVTADWQLILSALPR